MADIHTVVRVYCIALEGNAVTGSQWYRTEEARDAAMGKLGAEYHIPFTFTVPADMTADGITAVVDDVAWRRHYDHAD